MTPEQHCSYVVITVADLYNLDVDSLLAAAQSFEAWIVEACKLCSVQYEIDTASIALSFVTKLTTNRPPGETQRF
jgi:hypothetical protein